MTLLSDKIANLRRRVEAAPNDPATLAEATAMVKELQQHAQRALGWLAKGRLFEAAAYAKDCGNLANCIVEAQKDKVFVSAVAEVADLPSRRDLEPLVLAPVEAGRDSHAVERWISACVIHASLEDRLAAITAIKSAQPTQRRWTTLSTPLIDAAVEQVDDRLTEVLASGDESALKAMQQHLVDMGLTTEGRGAKAVLKIESRLQKLSAVSQAHRIRDTALAMHQAWAAMDPDEARSQLKLWQALAESTDADAASKVIAAPVIDWLKSLAVRDAADLASASMVDDLERALDEDRPMDDLERRYANLQRQEVAVPERVTSRLSHKIAEHRAGRRRIWAVSMGALAAVAAVVIVAIFVGDRARRQELLATNVETAVTDQLDADNPHGAQQTLQDAIADGHIDATLGESIGARIDRHREGWAERLNSARDHLSRAIALLDEEDSEANFDSIQDALDLAQETAPSSGDLDTEDARNRLRNRRTAWNLAQRQELQPRFDALDALMNLSEPGPREGQAWADLRDNYAAGLAELNAIAALPIAVQSDIQTKIQQRRTALKRVHENSLAVIEDLEQVAILLQRLQTVPRNEAQWAEAWNELVDNHAPLLTSQLSLKNWHDGRRDAMATAAVQHWREQVVPELLAAGLIGDAPRAEDVGVAIDRVREHLELTEDTSSPYEFVAKQLLAATGGNSASDAALDSLTDSGLTSLTRVRLSSGGVLYRRGMINADNPVGHAIVSTEDLKVPVSELIGATLPDGIMPAGSIIQVTESAMLEQTIKAIADGAPAATALLKLLDDLAAVTDGDTVVNAQVQLVTLKAMHGLIGDAAKGGPLDQWLVLTARSDSPLRENWPRVSYRGTKSDRRALIRGLARIIADAPSILALQDALEAPMQSLRRDAGPAAPACILVYSADGWTTIGTMPAEPYLLRVVPGQGTRFTKLDVEPSGRLSPPADLPLVPTLIFNRG